MFQWLKRFCEELKRESSVPPPPFKASKRTARIMYDLWYGRLTPREARQQAIEWGFSEDRINEMITQSTASPSYWSQYKIDEE